MRNLVIFVILFGLIGLIFGYFIFARSSGEYVSIKTIFASSGNAFHSFGRKLMGYNTMRQNILISGAVGAFLGLLVFYFHKKGK